MIQFFKPIRPLPLILLALASLRITSHAGGPPAGTPLLPGGVSAFKPAVWITDKSSASMKLVPVTGAAFPEALRLTNLHPAPQGWQVGAAVKTIAPIRQGDVLWLTLEARAITSGLEAGEAVADVVLMLKNAAGKEVRPLERSLTCGPEWTRTCIPLRATQDAEAGAANFAIRFGTVAQTLEVGGVSLINCGQTMDIATLPQEGGRYPGFTAEAPWRKAAAARIERLRKGDLPLIITGADGQPIAGAKVTVRMRRHAFSLGAAVEAKRLVSTGVPDDVRYRETVEKYFTKVVFANDLKWGRWIKTPPAERQKIGDALTWLDARRIPARGHVMVWPSWQYTPPFLKELADRPQAVKEAVASHIADQTGALGTRFADWDVINETYVHNDLLKLLGRDIMVDWFRLAHAGAPAARLFYNDYTMFHGTSPESPSQYFEDVIRFFQEQGAPIGGIGEQGHFIGNPPGPATIVASLDRFGALGLPIQITEFDIDTPDESLAADYTRDFMTAAFSHPAVDSIIHWEFAENKDGKPGVSLWRKDWTLRPQGQAWVDLVTKTWWTNTDGTTSADGTWQTRGFYGEYDVTVTHGGITKTVTLSLQPGNQPQTIVLP